MKMNESNLFWSLIITSVAVGFWLAGVFFDADRFAVYWSMLGVFVIVVVLYCLKILSDSKKDLLKNDSEVVVSNNSFNATQVEFSFGRFFYSLVISSVVACLFVVFGIFITPLIAGMGNDVRFRNGTPVADDFTVFVTFIVMFVLSFYVSVGRVVKAMPQRTVWKYFAYFLLFSLLVIIFGIILLFAILSGMLVG